MRCLLAVLPLTLLVACAGAFKEVRESRSIAVYQDPEKGPRLVLLSDIALVEDERSAFPRFHEATTQEMTVQDQQWAMRKLVLGGECFDSGAVIPPMTEDSLHWLWAELVLRTYRDIYPRTPDFDVKSRLDLASYQLGSQWPILAPFQTREVTDWAEGHAERWETIRKARAAAKGQERPQEQGEASPDGSTGSDTPPAPAGPVLAPQGAAGI